MQTTGSASAIVIALIAAFIDPAWALPVNTCLVIVLAVVQLRERRRVTKAGNDAIDAKRKTGATRRSTETDNDSGARRRWDDK